jgi:hypothetical protein
MEEKIMTCKEVEGNMESNEEQYLGALEKIKLLLLDVTEDFEPGDDDVSHFFENLYDALDEVIPM